MLIKDRFSRPLIKDIIQDLEDHGKKLFDECGIKITFPEPTTSWEDI